MTFIPNDLVVKISVSDILSSQDFYTRILGFKADDRYTLNMGGNFGQESYMQLCIQAENGISFTIGLYKDIKSPYDPLPETGTVPSFIVSDIETMLNYLLSQKVVIDKYGNDYILTNTSDKGYVDKFFFFRDPDNNSLVMRQNIRKTGK